MKWTFTVNKDPHEAEWRKGAMRCTMPEVIGTVDEIIFDGRRVPCGSASNLVKPTLENEAGGYAVITLAIKQFADYGSLQTPLSYATVITDVFDGDEELEKAQSFGGDRSEAGRYAAYIRWGSRLSRRTPAADGDPIYDSRVKLTPEQEAIAAQAEGAVVDAVWAKGTTLSEQQVNALVAAGFEGNGPPPKPPANIYVATVDDVVMSSVPDYYLLPKELQTKDVIDAQEKAFAGVQSLATQYKLGEIDRDAFQQGVKDIYGASDRTRSYDSHASKNPQLATASVVLGRQKIGVDGQYNMGQYPQNVPKLGVNPETGKSYHLESANKETAGKMVGNLYHPSIKQLEQRDKRIRSVAAEQEQGKKNLASYEKAVDAWIGIRSEGDSGVGSDDRKAFSPRNGKLAEVLGNAHGFHKGAQQVGGDDFDALAKSGRFYVVWRGADKETIDSMMTTRPHIGGGEQGLGTYTTYRKGRATGYGEPTPILIPKTAVRQNRMELDAWGSSYSDTYTYRHRLNLSHGESDNFSTGDFKVVNLSMLIVGPRNHRTPFIGDGYGDWVDGFYDREQNK